MSTQVKKRDQSHFASIASEAVTSGNLTRAALEQALDISPSPAFFMTPDLRVVGANAAGLRSLGLSGPDLRALCFVDLVKPGDRGRLVGLVRRLLSGTSSGGSVITRLRSKAGRRFALRLGLQVIDRSGEPILVAVSQGTARRRMEKPSSRAHCRDYLTDLPLRDALESRLRSSNRRAKLQGSRTAVLFIDLDGFKQVNDSFGHLGGDEVLRVVGERLRAWVRPIDFVARYGGDEFVMVIDNVCDEDEVEGIARRIRAELSEPLLVHGRKIAVSASIGVAIGQPWMPADDLVNEADLAMYRVKRSRAAMADSQAARAPATELLLQVGDL
jgi:diguanylate cyclase (GGDEF)-like protein